MLLVQLAGVGVSAPKRRGGGVRKVREGVWRVDVEVRRDPITGHRRRVSRQIRGTRGDAPATRTGHNPLPIEGHAPAPALTV